MCIRDRNELHDNKLALESSIRNLNEINTLKEEEGRVNDDITQKYADLIKSKTMEIANRDSRVLELTNIITQLRHEVQTKEEDLMAERKPVSYTHLTLP